MFIDGHDVRLGYVHFHRHRVLLGHGHDLGDVDEDGPRDSNLDREADELGDGYALLDGQGGEERDGLLDVLDDRDDVRDSDWSGCKGRVQIRVRSVFVELIY